MYVCPNCKHRIDRVGFDELKHNKGEIDLRYIAGSDQVVGYSGIEWNYSDTTDFEIYCTECYETIKGFHGLDDALKWFKEELERNPYEGV